ncbi:MAG: hypothetical protein HN548_12000, partial [Opitutae bacterium]|nr:hypothetical protein [Opitutae bacterium]
AGHPTDVNVFIEINSSWVFRRDSAQLETCGRKNQGLRKWRNPQGAKQTYQIGFGVSVVETNLARLNFGLELCETVARCSLLVFVRWFLEMGKLNIRTIEQTIANTYISKE